MMVAENARTVGDWNHDGDRDCAYTFCTHAIYLSLSLLLWDGFFIRIVAPPVGNTSTQGDCLKISFIFLTTC